MTAWGNECPSSLRLQIFAHDPSPQPDVGLWVVSVGRLRDTRHYITRRESPEDHIVYCVRGESDFEIYGRTHRVSPGMVYYIPAGAIHSYANLEITNWDAWWVHFDGDYARRLLSRIGLTASCPVVDLGLHEHLVDTFRDLCECCRPSHPGARFDAAGALVQLLLRMLKVKTGAAQMSGYLSMVSWRNRSVEEVAEEQGMTTEHFIRQFKARTGVTPWQHITRLKVIRAKELLTTTAATNAEMAKQLGLNNADYFSAWFRKHVGCSPRAFRRHSAT